MDTNGGALSISKGSYLQAQNAVLHGISRPLEESKPGSFLNQPGQHPFQRIPRGNQEQNRLLLHHLQGNVCPKDLPQTFLKIAPLRNGAV